jgi:cell surface protein SprA
MLIRKFVIGSFAAFTLISAIVGYSSERKSKRNFPFYEKAIIPIPDSSKTPSKNAQKAATPKSIPVSAPINPVKERTGDHVTDKQKDPFYLSDPANIQKNVEYDPISGKYVVTEKVGDMNIKDPTYLTYDEYLKYTEKNERNDFYRSRSNALQLIEEKGLIPTVDMKSRILDRIFGGSKVEIRPQGNLEVLLGGSSQTVDNPNIPIRARRNGGLDFDMNINMNVIGKIGDKLQLGIKYNTQSGFAFDNQVKLGWTGDEDDIIKEIELGNVSLPLTSRLITGSQALFGLKTRLQFGRLFWTSVISQQKSKRETLTIENGTQRQLFEIRADQYDENRHYFLSHYFRDQYDYALSGLPIIKSIDNVTRIEVWVTNRTGITQNVRDVMALADIGEPNPYHYAKNPAADKKSNNNSNGLYGAIATSPNSRFISNTVTDLQNTFGLTQGEDFEKTYARKLAPTEYTFNPQLGYISLNTAMNPNDVLAVAFQYESNGNIYQVGEFSEQVPPDSNTTSKVLYLKMLKGTTVRVRHPVYDLMMKNIYSLGAFQVSNDDFRLDVYYNDPGGGEKRYMPKGCIKGNPLLRVLNMDVLNTNNDAQPDGLFDFIPNVTIIPANGRLIFPVKEPFGPNLRAKFDECGSGQIADQYVYDQLYDSTKFVAQQYPEFNRFVIRGQYQGSNSQDISLGGFNIPQGSVVVSVGGRRLVENKDYTVDYTSGRVNILDQGILNSGQQIKIEYENNNQFGFQIRSLLGTRLDYRISNKINIGATVMRMTERPFTQKVNIGDDPIANTIFGADIKYETDAPWLTKALDKLPIYATKEMSTISAYAEVAHIVPGHQRAINGPDNEGQVYVDDFEGANTSYSIKEPINFWKIASVPRDAPGSAGQTLFPEANFINDVRYGYNRAKLAWYRIDNTFYANSTATPKVFKDNPDLLTDPYVRIVKQSEVFPNRPNQDAIDNNLYPLDLAFYPKERGPYNYEDKPGITPGVSMGVNPDGSLKDPATRWAGIMRSLDNTDLEANNTEFIEFWMMDPFAKNQIRPGGQLYINLGNVSEDILRDSRMQFENGLLSDVDQLDSTGWGRIPRVAPLVNAFDNDPNKRTDQDKGFDGLSSQEEADRWGNTFLTSVNSFLQFDASAKLTTDPSTDDYQFYLDPSLDAEPSILSRYKNFNNMENNSPVQTGNGVSNSGSPIPDAEDLNRDNTLNENEEYFQYRVDLFPGMSEANNKYIISTVEYPGEGAVKPVIWYQFRVPIRNFDDKVGNIPDFKSIQFIRMFLHGWDDSVILRMATLDLVRNQWRAYNLPIDPGSDNVPIDPDNLTRFDVTRVSIEENSNKQPVNYVLPPSIERTQAIGAQTNQFVAQNEQALALNVCGLEDGKSKAVFKNLGLDIRRYKRVKMFIHANRKEGELPLRDKEMTAFVRLGTDFKDNYYQYEIPLHLTADAPSGGYKNDSRTDQDSVWPASNNVDISLEELVNLKLARNAVAGYPKTVPYTTTTADGRILTIVGNPDLGSLKTVMLGIKNPLKGDPTNPLPDDDGQSKCVEVWFNELRVTDFDERGGTAALAEVAVKLADLGNISVSGSMHTRGFGQIDQKIDKRFKDNFYQYSASGNFELGRLLPEKAGIRLPFFGGISQEFSTPEFDPYQLDIPTVRQMQETKNQFGSDSSKNYLKTIQTITTRRGYNFSGVRIMPKLKAKSPQIWDPANFTFTYSFNEILLSDPFIEKNSRQNHLGQIQWNFAPQAKEFTPFKKLIKSKSKWLDLIRDFNFNIMPANMGVSTQMTRQLGIIKLRKIGIDEFEVPTTFNKFFTWDRSYVFKYNPFRSLSVEFSATNLGRIDEPDGAIDTKEKKDVIWNNVRQGGRNTNYSQTFNVNYTLPINKIPLFDFINANVGFNTAYNWMAAPQVRNADNTAFEANPLGNVINNLQSDKAKVDFNFKKIYDKVPFLRTYSSPNPTLGDKVETQKKREATRKAREKIQEDIDKLKERKAKLTEDLAKAIGDGSLDAKAREEQVAKIKKDIKAVKKQIRTKKKEYRNKQMPPDAGVSLIMRPLLALRKITVDYKQNKTTTLSGFMPNSQILGNDIQLKAPGYDFAFGAQPGDKFFLGKDDAKRDAWLDRAADNGWITSDTLLNQRFVQTRQSRLDITANLEPFQDLRIDLTLFRDYTENFSEFFKKTTDGGPWEHLNPMLMGSYSVSTVPINTFFRKTDAIGMSETYRQFEVNRSIISNRLAGNNPNSVNEYYNPSDSVRNSNYRDGYGPKSQEVLIPSFLAAYNKEDANKVKLNTFSRLPLPNWRITYNGLSKFKFMQKIFSSFTLSHGYSSTLTVNSFQTNLNAQKDADGNLASKDSISGNFFPEFAIPNIVMNEQLSPLIGIDMTFKNNINVRFDYKKSRTVTVTFADYQLIENNSTAITVGAGYTIRGLKLPIRIKGRKIRLDNDLKFRADISFRDAEIINHRIDQFQPQITSGAKNLTISPSIDYVINNRMNIRIFVDYNKTTPKISTGFPTTNVKGGIQLRLSLSQ